MRDRRLTVDPPEAVGGGDVGPTRTELFVAGLASCVGFYARRYLRRRRLDAAGLEVTTTWAVGGARPGSPRTAWRSTCPGHLPDNRRAGLLAQATHCTVHNSITHAPRIVITLAPTSQGTRTES